ncbi:MAG: Gfo/Idh/MocA family oxidoreductase [Bacteroidales bacterium]|nr:Gfo/Idh/MocA family oxidoreductase [Bacteroidales bacterium]
MKRKNDNNLFNRRNFIKVTGIGLGSGVLALNNINCTGGKKVAEPVIQGFEPSLADEDPSRGWVPFSDRKIRVGIVGYGVCKFGAAFGFQDHPNVDIVAVSDLFPDRCAELAKVCKCNKTYPSLEELVRDDSVDAVFVATDAPSHMKHCKEVLKHGKHVASAVPAVFGSLEEAHELFEAVKQSGLKYMMFETSYFRENLYAMRQIYKAGGFGKIIYAEGEYWHYSADGIDSLNNWRHGMPPQWYPTHSDAYYVGVTDNSFTEVSCLGVPSRMERYQKGNNRYNNPFGTEISFYKTSEGGMARMSRSSDTIGHGYGSETGRVRGLKGSYYDKYEGLEKNLPDLSRPPLPPGVNPGGHGGSHGYLTDEFIRAIIEDRKPLVDIVAALNLTVGGIVAHQSALKEGEWMKIPQFKL